MRGLATVFCLVFLACHTAHGQGVQKLIDADGPRESAFGIALAVAGDALLVGSQASTPAGDYAGTVFVFEQVDGAWQPAGRLENDQGRTNETFGVNLATAADTLALVAGRTGEAVLFARTPDGWVERGRIPLDPAYSGWTDIHLTHDAAYLATAGPASNPGTFGSDGGAVLVYRRTGSTWQLTQTLTASQEVENDDGAYGRTICHAGDHLFVSAQRDRERGTNAGAIYVYERSDDDWVEETKLLPGDDSVGQFGRSFSCAGDQLFVPTSTGQIRVVEREENAWAERPETIDLPAGVYPGEQYLSSVYALGDMLYLASEEIPGPGALSAFARDGATWSFQTGVRAPEPGVGDGFGLTVAITPTHVAIGAPYETRIDTFANGDTVLLDQAGAVYLYDRATFGVPTARDEEPVLPSAMHLAPAYPNPFASHITIPFELTADAQVELRIVDILGRHVATLFDAHAPAGSHRVVWDGRADAGHRVPNGMYIVDMRAGYAHSVRPITLIR